jgi:hypothetical protein
LSVSSARPWVAAAIVVALGWALGLLQWDPGEMAADFGELPFEAQSVLFSLSVEVLAALSVGLLRGFLQRRALATVLLVGLALAFSYLASFTSFSGFCIDPGEDVCGVVGAQQLAAGVLVPLSALAAGWVAESVGRTLRIQRALPAPRK